MKSKQEIIIRHFRDGHSYRQIADDLCISRNTVKKYVEEYAAQKEAVEFSENRVVTELIESVVETPRYNSSSRPKRKVTPELVQAVQECLSENQRKRSFGQHKQQMKKIDIYEYLCEQGFDISYPSICNLVRKLENKPAESFIKQSYAPGTVCEFDWGEVKLWLNGSLKTIQMAAFTSAYSNYRFSHLFMKADTSAFQQAHALFFNNINGVFQRVVYDNMRTVVKRFVGVNEKEPTDGLLQLTTYYHFDYRFCNIRCGNEKGHVERSVEYVRRKAFSRQDRFLTLDEANIYLHQMCDKLNQKPQQTKDQRDAFELLQIEKDTLIPAPRPFECGIISECRVDKLSTITIDTCRYSVPDVYVGRRVMVKIYPDRIVCYDGQQRLCEHERLFGAHQWSIQLEHFLRTLKQKPGALRGSVAFEQCEHRLQAIYCQYYQDNPKDFIALVHYIIEQKKTMTDIEQAVEKLKQISPTDMSTDKIKMICDRKTIPQSVEIDGLIEQTAITQLAALATLLPERQTLIGQEVIL